jgi:HK97 gp10 family phage protein
MTNNASYARFVEFGTSRMPGRFFLTDTVTRWKSIVAKVAKRLGTK